MQVLNEDLESPVAKSRRWQLCRTDWCMHEAPHGFEAGMSFSSQAMEHVALHSTAPEQIEEAVC